MSANHDSGESARRNLDRALDQLAGDPELPGRTARRVLERAGSRAAESSRTSRSPLLFAAAALLALLLAGLLYVAGPNFPGAPSGGNYAGLSAPGAQYIASEDSTAYYWEETDAIIATAAYGD
jgi:ferric-dicitrate binding protein FerR (iron transport regulator)